MRHAPRRCNPLLRLVLSASMVGLAGFIVAGVAPHLRAQAPACVAGIQEAEDAVLAGFEVGNDTAAGGGAYIHVPEGTVNRWSPSAAYRASFCFSVGAAGRFRLLANVWSDGGTSDSFFVAVDGVMVDSGRWDVAANTSYGPDYVNSHQAADPIEVALEAGEHTVDVYLREDGTRLDALALQRKDDATACRSGWVEAESGHLEGFTVVEDGRARGRAAIEVPDGAGSAWQPSANRASFCLEAKKTGVYRIEADVWAPSTTSDSFFVRVSGGDTYTWFPAVSDGYTQDLVADHGNADPVEVELPAGQHLLEVLLREDGTRLDRLRLVERPAGKGRDCGALRREAEDVARRGFEVGTDSAASGGAYLHVPEGRGSAWSPSDTVSATFCVRVKQAGPYRIVGGVWADGGTNDSFWIQVDGRHTGRWDVAWNTVYATDVVGFNGGADPLVVEFAKGDHVIEVMVREDGTRLDWLGIEPVEQA